MAGGATDDDLERLFASVRHLRDESGPVVLDRAYVDAIERVDALPDNQTGADKTWVLTALRQFRQYYARAVRVR